MLDFNQPAYPDDERGSEPCQAYRQNLTRHANATCVNLGTTFGSPALQSRGRPACGQCRTWGRALVVVRGRESRPHGEGGQLDECRTQANYARGGMYEPDEDGRKAKVLGKDGQ